jgi:hypothetical protein
MTANEMIIAHVMPAAELAALLFAESRTLNSLDIRGEAEKEIAALGVEMPRGYVASVVAAYIGEKRRAA